jgi:hypothetical protein
MWYSDQLGTYPIAKPFQYDGISYPAKAFQQPTILAAATLYPLVIEKVDTRYYTMGAETKTFANDVWTITYAQTEKDLETLRKELVRDWLQRLDSTLAPTDKFLARSDEMAQWFSSWPINPALQAWRDDVYLQFNTKMNSVVGAVTFAGLVVADEQPVTIPEQPVPYEVES